MAKSLNRGQWLGIAMLAAAAVLLVLAISDLGNGISFGDSFDFVLAAVLLIGGVVQLRSQ